MPLWLALLERGLNRALALDPELAHVLGPVDGARVAVDVTGARPIRVLVKLSRHGVRLAPDSGASGEHAQADADVWLSGSPAALLGLVTNHDELPVGAGVSVRGDIGVLQRVSSAARRLRPDWEEPIARALGDELGQPLSRGLRHAHATLAHVLRELQADTSEFLREESGFFAAADEVDAFSRDVDELRDGVARLEKRLALIARARARRS